MTSDSAKTTITDWRQRMKLLTVCATRNRYSLCKQMLESFLNTCFNETHIIFSLDEDDKQYEDYKNLFQLHDIPFLTLPYGSVTHHINSMYYSTLPYDYYHITNDDVIYRTQGWDKILLAGLGTDKGIVYGNDLFQGENLPTFPIVSREICEALGWLQCPSISKYYGDTIWKEIGQKTSCLYYNRDVIIEHIHNLNGKRDQDNPSYISEYSSDNMAYLNWYANESIRDIGKVMRCLKPNTEPQI